MVRLLSLVLACLLFGDHGEHLEKARAAIDASPTERDAYAICSDAYIGLGQDEEAIEFFSRLAARFPDVGHALFYRGRHEARLGRREAVRASLEQAVERDPGNAENWFTLGGLHFSLGEFEEAVRAFSRAHELEPATDRAEMLVRVLRIVGRYGEAERVTRTALETSPDSAELQYALGLVRMRQGRDAEAEQALRRAAELDPADDRFQRKLADLLTRTGRENEGRARLAWADRLRDYAEMGASLTERLSANPDHPELLLALGELELTVRNLDRAARWFSRAREAGASRERVAAGLAWILFSKGDIAAGERELAGIGHSREGVVELARAARLIRLDQTGEALETLERALVNGPRDRSFLRRAADLYASAGRHDRADALLREAITAPLPV